MSTVESLQGFELEAREQTRILQPLKIEMKMYAFTLTIYCYGKKKIEV